MNSSMDTLEEEIQQICKYANRVAANYGIEYISYFINPAFWKMISFEHGGKKLHIVLNVYHMFSRPYQHVAKHVNENYSFYKSKIGNTEEEAMEKWVNCIFHGNESLSSVRMHLAIEGIS